MYGRAVGAAPVQGARAAPYAPVQLPLQAQEEQGLPQELERQAELQLLEQPLAPGQDLQLQGQQQHQLQQFHQDLQQVDSEVPEDAMAQQQALEQLLRTIADKAAQMETKDILTLTAAFVAAANGESSPAPAAEASGLSAPPSGTLPLGATASAAESSTALPPGLQLEVQQQLQAVPQPPLPALAEVIGSLQTVKVSARTNVKSIAGAMSKALRTSEAFVATAVGPEGVNHGMKALCIARCYLAAEGLDLTATVTEVQPDAGINTGQCYAFIVVRMAVQAKPSPWASSGVGRTEPQPRFMRPAGQQTDMKVSGSGMAGPVGGAIAKCLREDREVIVTSVGPASVAKCVEALALARSYLRTDGIELFFFPGFEHIIMQDHGAGEQRVCVRVHVWPEAAVL